MAPEIGKDCLEKILRFIIEVDKLKSVTRKIRPASVPERFENSAEHSWQLALFALSLEKYCEPCVDMSRVIAMLLVHDIGEIDTGDTMVFVEGGWEERKAAELEAVRRIFGALPGPECTEFLSLWKEFEAGQSPESRLANALDRAMPVLLNLANHGQSWRDNQISYQRVVNRIEAPIKSGFPALWAHLKVRLEEAREKGFFAG
jgi:putative hydrolase of HD superfamily